MSSLQSEVSKKPARRLAIWPPGSLGELVFHGCYIQQGEDTLRKMWVREPKALENFLPNERQRLEPEAIKLASFHLSRFIRNAERLRDKQKQTPGAQGNTGVSSIQSNGIRLGE